MRTAKTRIRHKHLRPDSTKISRAQKLLRTDTETETIERALDLVLSEHRRNQLTWQAHERFLAIGVEIQDVYGKATD